MNWPTLRSGEFQETVIEVLRNLRAGHIEVPVCFFDLTYSGPEFEPGRPLVPNVSRLEVEITIWQSSKDNRAARELISGLNRRYPSSIWGDEYPLEVTFDYLLNVNGHRLGLPRNKPPTDPFP